jgi:hypothetical protein
LFGRLARTKTLGHHREQLVVDVDGLDPMGESVDTSAEQILRVLQLVDVSDHAKPQGVRLVDHSPVKLGRELLDGSAAVVDPDLDHVRFAFGQLPNGSPGLVFRRHAVGGVPPLLGAGPAVRHRYPAADGEQTRGAGDDLVPERVLEAVAVEAEAQRHAHSVIGRALEMIDEVLAIVVLRTVGHAGHIEIARMGVQVDERRDSGLAR